MTGRAVGEEDYSHGKWHRKSQTTTNTRRNTQKETGYLDRKKVLALGMRLRERGGSVTPEIS